MADIVTKQLQIGENIYKFKDEEARGQLATKQDIITAVVTPTIIDNGGTPTVESSFSNGELNLAFKNLKLRFSDLTENDKEAIRGAQGATSVYDSTTQNFLTTLETTMGQDQTKTMTQKAITDELTITNKSYTSEQIAAMQTQWWINNTTWRKTTGNYTARRIGISSFKGLLISITPQSGKSCKIAFMKDWTNSTGRNVTEWCSGESLRTITEPLSMSIPQDAKYLYVCYLWEGSNILPESVIISSTTKNTLIANSSAILDLEEEIRDNSTISREYLSLSNEQIYSLKSWWYINTGTNKWKSMTSNYAGKILNVAAYRGMELTVIPQTGVTMHIALLKTSGASGATAQFCDDFQSVIQTDSDWRDVIPSDASFLYINRIYGGVDRTPYSISIGEVMSVKDAVNNLSARPSIIYVDETSGDDDNSGTSTSPMKTIEAALDVGAEILTIILKSSVSSSIDFTKWEGRKKHVTIRGWKDARRFVKVGTQLNGLKSYPDPDYKDVYTWSPTEDDIMPSGDSLWLWQHNIPDNATAIQSDERHPLQKGRVHRRLSTCIKHTSSLESLLASGTASEPPTPKWFSDGEVLYIRAVTGSNIEDNPIIVPQTEAAITCPQSFDVTLIGIECWYGHIMVGGAFKFEAIDCAARYTIGAGAWRIDDCIGAMLIRCEADSNTMVNTSTGDGFNMSPNTPSSIYANGNTHTLIDCWAHDNRDDGYSDHYRSVGTIIGGLYEYNKKGGLTPSTGSNDTIIGAVCRGQNHGILYTGYDSSRNVGGTLQCIACECYNNLVNYRCQGSANSGTNKTVMRLIRCISRNAGTGEEEAGYSVGQNSTVYLHDCTHAGTGRPKFENQTGSDFVIQNGSVVS